MGLVKGVGFDSWRRVGSIMPSIKVYNTRDVDELIIVDITASTEYQNIDYNEISHFSAECFVPLTIGGGINSLVQIKQLLRSGADKVAINSALFEDIDLLNKASLHFGAQCIVASVDVKYHDDTYKCFSHAGTKPTGKDPIQWVKQLEEEGAGEILLTSIERDGTMESYDLDLISKVSEAVRIPVIASGGAGNYQHMLEAIHAGANAVAAASIFHFTEQTPREAKKYLSKNGINVRN
jgi:imidazole glycerol-phosphate synthase subunit HisF